MGGGTGGGNLTHTFFQHFKVIKLVNIGSNN